MTKISTVSSTVTAELFPVVFLDMDVSPLQYGSQAASSVGTAGASRACFSWA